MGLDPPTLKTLSPLLHRLAKANTPRLVLALRPQDPLPEWITHLLYLDKECRVVRQGRKDAIFHQLKKKIGFVEELAGADATKIQEQLVTPESEGSLASPSSSSSESLDTGEHEGHVDDELSHGDNNKAEVISRVHQQRGLGMTANSLTRQQNRVLKRSSGEVLVNMKGVCVKYGDKAVLGNWTQEFNGEGLWWEVRRGDRWGIFGPNGN